MLHDRAGKYNTPEGQTMDCQLGMSEATEWTIATYALLGEDEGSEKTDLALWKTNPEVQVMGWWDRVGTSRPESQTPLEGDLCPWNEPKLMDLRLLEGPKLV